MYSSLVDFFGVDPLVNPFGFICCFFFLFWFMFNLFGFLYSFFKR